MTFTWQWHFFSNGGSKTSRIPASCVEVVVDNFRRASAALSIPAQAISENNDVALITNKSMVTPIVWLGKSWDFGTCRGRLRHVTSIVVILHS